MMVAFPFSAIVGQHEMKRAILMTAVCPQLGGVLVFGDRGTGKSTAVRGLAALLPTMKTRKGCRYNCPPDAPADACKLCSSGKPPRQETRSTPVIDLPLGASEDRVCGSLDLERALTAGEKAFEPGLLASAHRGYLYIDEVNLLEDHIVDLLLDVAASGENLVEREGLSVRHPAKFVLVGSGNPEEGELRPQLLDRFGLSVDVAAPSEIKDRVEVVRRREAFEDNPQAFCARFEKEDAKVRRAINRGKKLLAEMDAPDEVLETGAMICLRLGVDGLRGELTLLRAAKAHAALQGRKTVTRADLVEIAPMALRHRLRRDPLDEAGSTTRVERTLNELSQTSDTQGTA
ncbi:MAG: magnesium chelatase ATPase subunit I [Pseudomonadota bacterium]